MSVALSAKFANIYCDEINLYYDGISTQLEPNLTFHAIVKNRFKLSVKDKSFFDEWIVDNFPASTIPQSIHKWQEYVTANRQSNVFATQIKIKLQDDIISFYKSGECANELVFLCDTNDDRFLVKLLKYFKWGLRNPFYLKAHTSAVNNELMKALEADIIPKIDKIVNFTNDPNQYCLSYIALDKLPISATPAWDNFTATFKYKLYKELFMAWVYSIFKADNKGRQILWIEGMGKSGKSTVIRTIYDYLHAINPELAQSIEKLFFEDKFSLASYKNCRLAIISDGADRSLIKREVIKNLTGQDIVVIREMHKPKVTMEIHCKIMVASNYAPYIFIDQEHELSRMLFLKLDDDKCYRARDEWNPIINGDWNKQLEKELLPFINKCSPFYEKHLSPDRQNFIVYNEMIDDLRGGSSSNIEKSVDDYWSTHWVQDDTAPYTSTTWIIDDYVTRFMKGYTPNKLTVYRRYVYVKMRKLKIAIENLEVGGTQIIKGWRYTNKKCTFKELIDSKMKQINEQFNKD